MDKSVLDPEIAAFLETMARAWSAYPPFMTMPLADARAAAEKVRAPWTRGGPAMKRIFDLPVPVSGGELRIRVYDPGITAEAPVLIYLHGGGFTLFSLDTHDRLMREYAASAGLLVVGVDYPLSPEVRYPVALDQLVELIDWLASGGAGVFGGDPARLAIGGDSAGANLSLAAALRLRDRGAPTLLRALLLNYGGFTGRCSDEAEARYGGPGSVLDRAEVEYYFENYLGAGRFESDDSYACQT
ncbi:MAG TPA: alpha/beta hydrolase fold domain-containing protein, partial [Sphingomonas sp.]